MLHTLRKIFSSRVFRLVLSGLLIFLAFRKVEIKSLWVELAQVPLWFVAVNLVYFALVMVVGAYRWATLLLPKVSVRDLWVFTKSSYLGLFYNLFFPTSVAGDLLKWVPLQKNYPELNKTRLVGSVFLDRIVGFTAFVIVAVSSASIGRTIGLKIPDYLLWLFWSLFFGLVIFYVMALTVNIKKYFGWVPYIEKIVEVVDLLKSENQAKLLKCLGVAFVGEFAWMAQYWFFALIFNTGMSLLSIYIFVPVITLVLLLPVSVAGFGAREQMFLFFFSQMGIPDAKILLVSTFAGILGVISALFGGLLSIF